MFSFELPVNTAITVNLPTGGVTTFVHVGGGRFLSKLPPIAMPAPAREPIANVEDVPVTWDGQTMPGDGQAHAAVVSFDVRAAAQAVEAASAAGDTYAQRVMEQVREAEAEIRAAEQES